MSIRGLFPRCLILMVIRWPPLVLGAVLLGTIPTPHLQLPYFFSDFWTALYKVLIISYSSREKQPESQPNTQP